jgi:hypothetical protein
VGTTLIAAFKRSRSTGIWRTACAAGTALLVLTSCGTTTPELPPDELLRRLQAGEPVVDCGLPCREAWRANRTTALLLDETRHWRDLALLVMRIGYINDLTYYYLGRAGEGLGFPDAAKTYYQISVRLTSAGITCTTEGANYCNGQVFPAAAQAQLASLTAPSPTSPSRSPKAHHAQHQRRPPPKQATPPAPASAHTTNPSSAGAAIEPATPDFAAPPPIRR